MLKCVHLVCLALVLAVSIDGRTLFPYQRELQFYSRPETFRSTVERGLINLCLGLEKMSNLMETESNTVIAPLSVASVTALLLAGARGVTKKELEMLFGIDNISHSEEEIHRTMAAIFSELQTNGASESTISSGSGLFVQHGTVNSPDYMRIAKELYHSEVIPVDFKKAASQTTDLINKWVTKKTEGKIHNLISDGVDPATIMLIANVFYFKGAWEEPFIKASTKIGKFHVSKKETIAVPLMVSLKNAHYGTVRGSHSVLGLPYKGGDITMYFVLPVGDLRRFVNSLTDESMHHFINQTVKQDTIVAIPRMRIDGKLELSGALSSLGVRSLFDPRLANLSGINKGLYVNEMLHKVSIEVTETGTEAAAATSAIVFRDGSIPIFRADRPFLFFIYHHRSGTVLFYGTVYRPEPIND